MLLLFLFFNIFNAHENDNQVKQTPIQDFHSGLTLLQHFPQDLKTEIYSQYGQINYSRLLKNHYSLGTFERDPYNTYRLTQYKGQYNTLEIQCHDTTGSWWIVHQDNTLPTMYCGLKLVTELNKKNYFMAGNALIHLEKLEPHYKINEVYADRILKFEENSTQLFDCAAIHPTQNILVSQSAPNYDELHQGNVLHLYSWNENMPNGSVIQTEKTFTLSRRPDHLYFMPDTINLIIYLYRSPDWLDKYYKQLGVAVYNIDSSTEEYLGSMDRATINNYLSQKNLKELPAFFTGMQIVQKPSPIQFDQIVLTCLAYNWIISKEKNTIIGQEILAYFLKLSPKNRRELIWKTTTPEYGNLFKRIHTFLTQNEL